MNNNLMEFRFGDLISDIYKGKALNKDELTATDNKNLGVRYITRTGENNGCELIALRQDIPDGYIEKGNALSIGDTTATCFYQDEDFVVGDHMVVVRADWLRPLVALYVVAILNNEQYKYSYGRAFLMDRIKDTIIKLPVDNDGNPDWQFMEDYMKSLHHKPLTTKNIKTSNVIDKNGWEEFSLDGVFKLKGGFYNKKPEHSIDGKIPFLASTETNNGVTEYYDIEDIRGWDKVGNEDNTLNKKLYKGNCIAVTVNGSVCNAFYQKETFTCSHDITAFYVKKYDMNVHLAMFLCTIIMQDKYRWSYGRKPHDVKKFGKSVIKLPVKHNPDGSVFIDTKHTYSENGYVPDWQFMEDYIKSLPYGDRI